MTASVGAVRGERYPRGASLNNRPIGDLLDAAPARSYICQLLNGNNVSICIDQQSVNCVVGRQGAAVPNVVSSSPLVSSRAWPPAAMGRDLATNHNLPVRIHCDGGRSPPFGAVGG